MKLKVEDWVPSRRTVAGLLSGGSILGSRAFGDLLSEAVEVLDVGIAALTVYLNIVGEGTLGLYLTWFLAGYLIYAYTPELYLDYFGDIVEERGFRAITATISVYFGLLWGGLMPNSRTEEVFGVFSSDLGRTLVLLFASILGGTLAFSVYSYIARSERLTDLNSKIFETFEEFTMASQRKNYWQHETLSQPTRSFDVIVANSGMGIIFLGPCLLLGIGLAVVNGLPLLPELFVLLGVVFSFIPGRKWFAAHSKNESVIEIELLTIKGVLRAFQNLKSLALIFCCLIGLSFSTIVLVVSIPTLSLLFSKIMYLTKALVTSGGMTLGGLATALALLWLLVAIFSTPLAYFIYGLVYWLQQLKRLPSYGEFWEQYWRGVTREVSPHSSSRPRGLFLPGNALILMLWVFLWLNLDENTPLVIFISYCLVWTVIIAVIAWSLLTVSSREAQPLENESRDVMIALVLQVLSIFIVGLGRTEPRYISISLPILISIIIIMIIYLPEVTFYATRRVGAVSYLSVIYSIIFAAILLLALEIWTKAPAFLYMFIIIMLVIWFLYVYLYETTASLDRE